MDKEEKIPENELKLCDSQAALSRSEMKGRIYKIWSPGRPEVYVGSSQCSLERIMARHKGKFRDWLYDKGDFVTSTYIFYQQLAGHPVYIETLEEGEFETLGDMRKLEREYIEKLPTVNQYKPGQSLTEEEKREHARGYMRKYYQRIYCGKRVQCPKCKKSVAKDYLKGHMGRCPVFLELTQDL